MIDMFLPQNGQDVFVPFINVDIMEIKMSLIFMVFGLIEKKIIHKNVKKYSFKNITIMTL